MTLCICVSSCRCLREACCLHLQERPRRFLKALHKRRYRSTNLHFGLYSRGHESSPSALWKSRTYEKLNLIISRNFKTGPFLRVLWFLRNSRCWGYNNWPLSKGVLKVTIVPTDESTNYFCIYNLCNPIWKKTSLTLLGETKKTNKMFEGRHSSFLCLCLAYCASVLPCVQVSSFLYFLFFAQRWYNWVRL